MWYIYDCQDAYGNDSLTIERIVMIDRIEMIKMIVLILIKKIFVILNENVKINLH